MGDEPLVKEQFLSKRKGDKANQNSLRVAYLLAHPEQAEKGSKPVSLRKAWAYFESQVERVHKLVNIHKTYIARAPARQKVALDNWQRSSTDVGVYQKTGMYSSEGCFEINIAVRKTPSKSSIKKLMADSLPVDNVVNEIQELKSKLRGLQALVHNAPRLPHNEQYTLYRGVQVAVNFKAVGKDAAVATAGVEDVFTWDTFSSFTISPMVALNFSSEPCCVFRLQWSHDVPSLVVPLNGWFHEFEVIVPPGRFRVSRVWYVNSPWQPDWRLRVLDLEWVGK